MEMKDEKREILIDALNCLITEKKYEIEVIEAKTEEDYGTAIRINQRFGKNPFCLEERIQRDVEEVNQKIKVIEEVKKEVNDGSNRMLFVPNYIQLHLTGE